MYIFIFLDLIDQKCFDFGMNHGSSNSILSFSNAKVRGFPCFGYSLFSNGSDWLTVYCSCGWIRVQGTVK